MKYITTFVLILILVASSVAAQDMPFAKWPELQKGHAPDAVFQVDDIDSINLLNGNLTLTIPLGGNYPVGPNLSYGLTLVYNSNPWEALSTSIHRCNSGGQQGGQADFYPKTFDQLSNAGPGWMINLGRFKTPGREYFDDELNLPDFIYVAPDGSHHSLHPELHYQGPTQSGVYYSRDGSFVRMIDNATSCAPGHTGTCRRLEFPDGSHQEFHKVGAGNGEEDFRPTLISDAFGNRIEISYADYEWTITDSHGRSQVVDFDTSTPARSYSKVTSVTLAAFGGREAIYSFEYSDPVSVERHQYAETFSLDAQCTGDPWSIGTSGLLEQYQENVEFLERLVQPDGSYYEMSYNLNEHPDMCPNCKSGAIEHLRLASGLHYRWQYSWLYGRLRPGLKNPEPFERVAGISRKQRYILDENGDEQNVVTWVYEPSKALFHGAKDPDPTMPGYTPCFQQTDVLFFAGDPEVDLDLSPIRYSRHYFNTAKAGPGDISFTSRQSLPFTACLPDGDGSYFTNGLYLSQETLDPANPDGAPIRSMWVNYETDAPLDIDDKDGDRRLIRQRTVFHDDGGRWTENRWQDFDGLGNFRKQIRASNFENTGGDQTRITTYNMNANGLPSSGPDFTPMLSSRWLLGLFGEKCVHQGSTLSSCGNAQQRVFYKFNSQNGFLEAMRQLRGSQKSGFDILTVYADPEGDDGFVDSEKLYGGDRADDEALLPTTGSSFFPDSAPLDHHVEHTYEHGVRSRSIVMEGSTELLRTLDQKIDRNTGLASKSYDAAGLETTLDFDRMGRVTKIEMDPSHNVATQFFRYTVPTDLDPDLTLPLIAQFCEGGGNCPETPLGLAFEIRECEPDTADYDACHGSQLGERRYFYDRQGRLVDERRLIPWAGGDIESYRQTAYDLADRKAWETEWHVNGQGFDVFFTSHLDYDLLDRPRTIRRPDGKETTLTYTGERLTTRTVGVRTGAGETSSTTTERRDGFGRLIQVTEPSGSGGANVHTTYRYDQGDHLIRACVDDDTNPQNGCSGQERIFTYDGTGLLTSENHPEIDGAVSFTYDARRNVLSKDLAGTAYDLSYVYDAAGRHVEVYDGDGKLFLESFYGRVNDGPERVGKLYQARRHNRVPENAGSTAKVDHVVTETFDWSAPGDRLAGYTVRSDHGASFDTRYAYEATGALTSLVYPACDRAPCASLDPGPTLAIDNHVGRIVAIEGWINSFRYRPRGTFSRIDHANNVTDETQRNTELWKPIEKIRFVKTDGEVLWDSGSYEFDGAGNIYQIGSESFTYDRVSRLTSATVVTTAGTASESLTYDAFGNIDTITRSGEAATRQLSPDATNNRLGAALASYDAAGNVTSWTEDGRLYAYEYAPDNRITSLAGNGRARSFLYTASGERFAILDYGDGDEEYMPRDPGNGLLSRFERAPSGNWQRSKDYIRADGKAVATLANGVVRHLHHDHLGSTRMITGGDGAMIGDLTTYFPFGTYAFDGTPGAEEHRFTGHERDDVGQATAALDYMHARYHAPAIGRFLSVDPAAESAKPNRPLSWNRYSYVGNSPTRFVDPDGREDQDTLRVVGYGTSFGGNALQSVQMAQDGQALLAESAALRQSAVRLTATFETIQSIEMSTPGTIPMESRSTLLKEATVGFERANKAAAKGRSLLSNASVLGRLNQAVAVFDAGTTLYRSVAADATQRIISAENADNPYLHNPGYEPGDTVPRGALEGDHSLSPTEIEELVEFLDPSEPREIPAH